MTPPHDSAELPEASVMAVREDLDLLFPEGLDDVLAEDLYGESESGGRVPTWSAARHQRTGPRTPPSAALGRAPSPPIDADSPADAAVQAEVCLVDRGADAEPVPPHRDTTTMTPEQPPLVALPAGWSLA